MGWESMLGKAGENENEQEQVEQRWLGAIRDGNGLEKKNMGRTTWKAEDGTVIEGPSHGSLGVYDYYS
ncbi:hypothetical protein NPX13_g9475 [Xylaria arbuscula]|uniref:Uncharacterized protein n=1 Tax=Xylaria arbuscula TaxID=114810 RepID=A0A9W8N6N1_9PEZI|nr:hypothetical protein NPX13_g9475 [Xylaria arbuscula]